MLKLVASTKESCDYPASKKKKEWLNDIKVNSIDKDPTIVSMAVEEETYVSKASGFDTILGKLLEKDWEDNDLHNLSAMLIET